MIALSDAQRATVRGILARRVPGIACSVFGSRISGTAKPWSDLDLLLQAPAPLDPAVLGQLKEDFSESDLPFRVDLAEAAGAAPGFLASLRPIPLD